MKASDRDAVFTLIIGVLILLCFVAGIGWEVVKWLMLIGAIQ